MNKKVFNLEKLEVQSFVTSSTTEKATIKGGSWTTAITKIQVPTFNCFRRIN